MRSDAEVRLQPGRTNQTDDFELYSPSRFGNLGRPVYKPEHWDKVQQLDMWTNKYDPVMTCQPLGVPREGPPRRIYPDGQRRDLHLYRRRCRRRIRRVSRHPDRRPPAQQRREVRDHVFGGYRGTLGGRHAGARLRRVHRYDMAGARRFLPLRPRCMSWRRFTRQGDVLLYDVTVEDPEVLVEPWVLPTRTVRRNPNPDAGLIARARQLQRSRAGECLVPDPALAYIVR